MCKALVSSSLFLLWLLLSCSLTPLNAVETWPGERLDRWHGYVRHNFTVDGCPAWVVEPKQASPGNPWTWCMEFPDAFTERTGVLQLRLREDFTTCTSPSAIPTAAPPR